MQIGNAAGAAITILLSRDRRTQQHAAGSHDVRDGADAIVKAYPMCRHEGADVARPGAAVMRGGNAAKAASNDEMHEAEICKGGNRLAHVTLDPAACRFKDRRRYAAGE